MNKPVDFGKPLIATVRPPVAAGGVPDDKLSGWEINMAEVCKSVEIGRHGNIPEFRTRWRDNLPRFEIRRSAVIIEAQFCGPDDLLDGAWSDIVQCALGAAGAATIAAIAASPPAALPAFQAAFMSCITAKLPARASEIGVGLSAEQRPVTDWTAV